jgi:hypothetical protein
MKTVTIWRIYLYCTITGIIALMMTSSANADSFRALQESLPKKVNGWKASTEDHIYNEKSIFGYINGAAEVYRAYNMKQCLARRYSIEKGPAIVLDIFDMGLPQDAFGVFTHDTDGNAVAVGQEGRYRPGWLSFWKHRYFISIYMEEETKEAEKAVMELGRNIASKISESGNKPKLLLKLPIDGLQAQSIRYLHHPIILNYHYYISDENILNISPHTEAVLASYQMGDHEAQLLIVKYSDNKTAKDANRDFYKNYLPDADTNGTARLEDGKWAGALQKGEMLIIVLEADTREAAHHLLTSIH